MTTALQAAIFDLEARGHFGLATILKWVRDGKITPLEVDRLFCPDCSVNLFESRVDDMPRLVR